jgi:hypothetical protein
MILLYAVLIGLVLGLLSGGRLAPLGAARIRFWPVALAGLLFQVALFSSPLAAAVGVFGPSLYVASTAVVLAALIVNLRQPGFALIILGSFLNLAVIMLNGGQMPASPEALTVLTGTPALPTTDFSNSMVAAAGTPLWFLGDIFVLPRPFPFANVFSIGDVLIGLGGAIFIVRTMHQAADRPPRRPTLAHG